MIKKCKDCEHLRREWGALYCEIAFKKWSTGREKKQPYVGKNGNCRYGKET